MSGTTDRPPVDWEDHVVDRALHELHGDRPPDLADSIVHALADRRPATAERLPTSDGAGGGRLAASSLAAMALAAVALVVAVLAWAAAPPSVPPAAARFEVAVTEGTITPLAVGMPPQAPIPAGATAGVLLAPGFRLLSSEWTVTDVRIGPFGLVHTEPATTLEVIDMNVQTKNGWVTAGSLALAVVAGGASWHWIGMQGRAEAGEVMHLKSPDDPATRAGVEAMQARADQLLHENDLLRQRVAALEGETARIAMPIPTAPPTQPVAAASAELPPEVTSAPTFDDERFAELLGQLDWKLLGEVAAEMGIPLVELMQKLDAGEELPMELAVKISKLNMQLVEQLPKIMKAGLPGSGPNGSYTHPLVVANQLASLLASGKLPLDPTQRSAIAALVRGFSAEMAGIHDMQSELDLDRLVAEVSMKDRMYEDLAQQLGPEQRALLYPEGAGTFDGSSLFRTGLVWQTFVAPLEADSPATYVESAGHRMAEELNVSGETAAQIRAIMEQAAGAAPAEMWAASSPAERAQGGRFLRHGRAMRAAQMQQAWMRRVLREVALTPEQRERLRTMRGVLVPVPR